MCVCVCVLFLCSNKSKKVLPLEGIGKGGWGFRTSCFDKTADGKGCWSVNPNHTGWLWPCHLSQLWNAKTKRSAWVCVNMSSRTSHGLWKKYLLLPWKTIISPSYTLFEVQCSCHLGTTWHKLNLILMIWSWWGWHQFKSNIDLIAQWYWHRTFQVETKTSAVKKMLIHSKQWSSMINFVAYIDNS
jgi:hypothetical protein